MRQILLLTLTGILAICAIAAIFTLNQTTQERLDLTNRLQSRTLLVADSLIDDILPDFRDYATSSVQATVDRFATQERVAGIGAYDTDGTPVAVSSDMPSVVGKNAVIVTSMDSDTAQSTSAGSSGGSLFILADPIAQNGHVIGALVVVENSQYIDDAIWALWRADLLRVLLESTLFAGAIAVIVWLVFYRAISEAAESVRKLRAGSEARAPSMRMLRPLTSEIAKMSTSLHQARSAARQEARMRLEKLDSPWTAERLQEFIKAYLRDRPLFVISHGEPYVHKMNKRVLEWSVPAGGVITALEPVMEACGGTWIACATGEADKEASDGSGKLRVPPEEPKYTLKRIFLTQKELKGYYIGFANEALWPLCHLAHVRPQFRKEDWAEYGKVNERFAEALLEEIRGVERPVVLVQDYHLALVPSLIKKRRPDAQVALFWHIPWPSAVQFSVCPWRRMLLEGILGADLVGFHTQLYCNAFMETVAAEIEARIDYERFAVVRSGHETRIEPFPISIAFPGQAEVRGEPDRSVLSELGIKTRYLALGVDRLDYIKGILERFRGVEFLLTMNPEYRGHITLLQIASPTRDGVEKYREYAGSVFAEAQRINAAFGTAQWKPIVIEHRTYSHMQLRKLYQLADVCLVTSIHDGMNLVAKEYVAARDDEGGALILSRFTGASRDLPLALQVNPYDAEETAEALHQALTMPKGEQRRRMKGMRTSVRDYNVYRWSAELIKALTSAPV